MFYLENGTKNHINITGGPLSYRYQVYEIHIHYGQQDEMGSEHSINGYSFPAEVNAHASLRLIYRIYAVEFTMTPVIRVSNDEPRILRALSRRARVLNMPLALIVFDVS